MGHGHGHGHGASAGGHGAGRAADRRRLRIVLLVAGVVLAVEVVGAVLTGSLALLADAGHVATDAAAVALALGASYVASLPGGPRSTFGYHRAEILAALLNAVVLLVVCGYLAWAAAPRLFHPGSVEVDGAGMLAFAGVGLVANGASLAVLARGDTSSLNLRGALTEVAADLVGSVLAVLAALAILTLGWQWTDPVASLLIAALILPRSLVLLRDATAVLLEIAPVGLDLDDVERHVLGVPGVVDVHDLHAWVITSGLPSLSAHVTVEDDALAARGVGAVLDDLCHCVAEHFGVQHATFQVEPVSHRDHEDLGEVHA